MLRAPLLTLHETAEKLKVKESTIRQWIKDRELRAIKFGREWRIAQIDLETFLNRNANMPPQTPNMPAPSMPAPSMPAQGIPPADSPPPAERTPGQDADRGQKPAEVAQP